MDTNRDRTWAEISLSSIKHNYLAMRERLPSGCRFLGVVKSDAYGHGAVPVARLLERLGCEMFGVACLSEAIKLRENGVTSPILVLGYSHHSVCCELVRYDVIQTVFSCRDAEEFSKEALNLGQALKIHIKTDSGMGRLGFTCHGGADPTAEIIRILELPGLDVQGIFTHFAVSDITDAEYTNMQFSSFVSLVRHIEALRGKRFIIKHCANSGAVLNYPETYMDMVRPGIALFGAYSGPSLPIHLNPAMALRTRIVQIKEFKAGDTVGYGRTYTASGNRKIAVLPIGYGDGLHRLLSGKIDVLVCGKRAPQVGRICMDMCMIDITDIPEAKVQDIVTIFGSDGNESISIENLATAAETISYELLCAISNRVPRVYDSVI